jgi:hypothetical protein
MQEQAQPTMPQRSPFSASGGGMDSHITVADILPFLPSELVRPNTVSAEQPIILSQQVMDAIAASGVPAVPLFEVYRVCPVLFQMPISPHDPRTVVVPMNKLGIIPRAESAAAAGSPFGFGVAMPEAPIQNAAVANMRPAEFIPAATQQPLVNPLSGSPFFASGVEPAAPAAPAMSPFAMQVEQPFAAAPAPQVGLASMIGAAPAHVQDSANSVPSLAPQGFAMPGMAAIPIMGSSSAVALPPTSTTGAGANDYIPVFGRPVPAGAPPPTPVMEVKAPPPVAHAAPANLPSLPITTASVDIEVIETPLARLLKGQSPEQLGFDATFIPAWVNVKLPARLVHEQAHTGQVSMDLGTVMDHTEEGFRAVIAHGKRTHIITMPAADLLPVVPPTGMAEEPTPKTLPLPQAFTPIPGFPATAPQTPTAVQAVAPNSPPSLPPRSPAVATATAAPQAQVAPQTVAAPVQPMPQAMSAFAMFEPAAIVAPQPVPLQPQATPAFAVAEPNASVQPQAHAPVQPILPAMTQNMPVMFEPQAPQPIPQQPLQPLQAATPAFAIAQEQPAAPALPAVQGFDPFAPTPGAPWHGAPANPVVGLHAEGLSSEQLFGSAYAAPHSEQQSIYTTEPTTPIPHPVEHLQNAAPSAAVANPFLSVAAVHTAELTAAEPNPSTGVLSFQANLHSSSPEQMLLRALFGVAETFDAAAVVRHVALLPGVLACACVHKDQAICHGSTEPAALEFQQNALQIANGIQSLNVVVGSDNSESFSIQAKERVLTFNIVNGMALGVLHADREPSSSLRDKVTLIARELSKLLA